VQKLTTNITQLKTYLKNQGWLKPEESIASIEKPGEGNMNFTLRVNTGARTFIIKQSRGYVEKYPQVKAPEKRALKEAEFYELTSKNTNLKAMMPKLIAVDEINNVLQLEDLGSGKDFIYLYKEGKTIPEDELLQLMDFAALLHKTITTKSIKNPVANRDMRKLNHEHIFLYPYMENNGIDMDAILPGLAAVAASFKKDKELQGKLKPLGDLYLADGAHLLHGDYFPGSWLKTADGIKIIDPEFCFFGVPEFEIGITIAHLKMANQSEKLIKSALNRYSAQAELDENLRRKFTAAEILRRILGLAQLPLEIDLAKRKELVEEARNVILP